MALGTELVQQALQLAGVTATGEPADANDLLEAKDMANNMLGQWSTQDLMLFYDKVDVLTLVPGQISYQIGPTGADLVIDRPIEILSVMYRNASGLDTPVQVISHDSYQQLIQKMTQQTLPMALCYQPTNPNGTILVWPTPTSGSLRLMSNKLLTLIDELSNDVPLPIGYDECFVTNLAKRLCVKYGRTEMLEEIKEMAIEAMANVKRKNKKKNIMGFDPAIVTQQNRHNYNPYTDQ